MTYIKWYTYRVSYIIEDSMDRKVVKKNRRETIFTAAVKCFNKNGYYGTSMDMIAERAKITKRGLYYHFKSKDELFIELFHYMNKKCYEQIPSFATEVSDPEERMLMFVKIANQVVFANTDFLKFSHEFMSIGIRKPKIRKVFTSYYREQVENVTQTIERGIESGKFLKTDPEKVARAIVLLTIGAFHVYFSLNADFELTDQHTFNVNHILQGLKKDRTLLIH